MAFNHVGLHLNRPLGVPSGTLEFFSMYRTTRSIKLLIQLRPREALLVRDEVAEDQLVPVESLCDLLGRMFASQTMSHNLVQLGLLRLRRERTLPSTLLTTPLCQPA